MPKPSESLDDELDGALGDILGQGWTEPREVVSPAVPSAHPVQEVAAPALPPQYPALPSRDDEPDAAAIDEDEPVARGRLLDIGVLADLAAGRKTAEQAAAAVGVSTREVNSALAVALREVPPEEIAKAMGLQAAEQQLKSGAIYGAVLADLVNDMATGRLKPDQKIELARLLARVGRVEPKDDKQAAGGGFVLNINLGAGAPPVTLEAQ